MIGLCYVWIALSLTDLHSLLQPHFAPHMPSHCLWLGRLPPDTTKEDIASIFLLKLYTQGSDVRRPVMCKEQNMALVYLDDIGLARRVFTTWDRMVHNRKILVSCCLSDHSQKWVHLLIKFCCCLDGFCHSSLPGGVLFPGEDISKTWGG